MAGWPIGHCPFGQCPPGLPLADDQGHLGVDARSDGLADDHAATLAIGHGDGEHGTLTNDALDSQGNLAAAGEVLTVGVTRKPVSEILGILEGAAGQGTLALDELNLAGLGQALGHRKHGVIRQRLDVSLGEGAGPEPGGLAGAVDTVIEVDVGERKHGEQDGPEVVDGGEAAVLGAVHDCSVAAFQAISRGRTCTIGHPSPKGGGVY